MKLRVRNKQTGKLFTQKVSAREYISAVEEFRRKAKKAWKEPDDYEVLGEVKQ